MTLRLFFLIIPHLNAEYIKLCIINIVRAFAHEIERAVCGRECDYITDVLRIRQHHGQTLEADTDSSVGRCSVTECFEEEAKLLLRLFHRETDCLKYLLLQILIMNTD